MGNSFAEAMMYVCDNIMFVDVVPRFLIRICSNRVYRLWLSRRWGDSFLEVRDLRISFFLLKIGHTAE